MKKWMSATALVLASMLLAGSAMAVEVNLDKLYPVVDEPVEMSLMLLRGATSGKPEDIWFWQYAEQKTKVKWNVTEVDGTVWPEKKGILLASGDYPDVFWGPDFTNTELMKNGKDGIFIPLNGLIDQYGDRLLAMMDKVPGAREMITCPDGYIYSLPLFQLGTTFSDFRAYINAQWLKNLNLEAPTTLDEFFDILVAFKEQDANGNGDPNDEIPWSGSWIEYPSGRWAVLYALGFMCGDNLQNVAVKDGAACYMPMHPDYRKYLEFMNKCWTAGVIDPDFFTQTAAQFRAKGAEMIVGFSGDGSPHAFVGYDPANLQQYEHITPLVAEAGQMPVWYKSEPVQIGTMEITDACKTPEVAMRWMNMFYDPNEAIWLHNGPIYGSEYDPDGIGWKPESGSTEPMGLKEQNPENLGWWDYLCAYMVPRARGTNWMVTMDDVYALDQADIEFNRVWPTEEAWWRDQNAEKAGPYFQPGYPPVVFYSEEQNQTMQELMTPLSSYVKQKEAEFITGAESFDNYDAFVEEMRRLGADKIDEIFRTTYEAGN